MDNILKCHVKCGMGESNSTPRHAARAGSYSTPPACRGVLLDSTPCRASRGTSECYASGVGPTVTRDTRGESSRTQPWPWPLNLCQKVPHNAVLVTLCPLCLSSRIIFTPKPWRASRCKENLKVWRWWREPRRGNKFPFAFVCIQRFPGVGRDLNKTSSGGNPCLCRVSSLGYADIVVAVLRRRRRRC